jgi:hypothetical protein
LLKHQQVPGGEDEGFEAEGYGDGDCGGEPLLGVDRGGQEVAVDEAAEEAADVGGVGDVGIVAPRKRFRPSGSGAGG